MKIIEIEKELNLQGVVDILELTMQDQFTYQQEADGVRCVGPFYVNGRYSTLNEVRDFQEVYEFDVFASNDKLDGLPFSIEYDGYDYSILSKVTLYLHFKVHGIKGEESEPIDPQEEPFIPFVEQEEEVVEPLSFVDEEGNDWQISLAEAMSLTTEPVLKEGIEAVAPTTSPYIEEVVATEIEIPIETQGEIVDTSVGINEVAELSMMEELFENKDNVITSYSFVVIKEKDTYASIAHRYQVEEEALRKANGDKQLIAKNLAVLPYTK